MFASVFVESENIYNMCIVHTWMLDGVGHCDWSPHCFTVLPKEFNLLGAHSQAVTRNGPFDIAPVLLCPSLEHASESDAAAQKREPLEAQYFAWCRHLSFSANCEWNEPGHDACIS